jgi:hypothetical protein
MLKFPNKPASGCLQIWAGSSRRLVQKWVKNFLSCCGVMHDGRKSGPQTQFFKAKSIVFEVRKSWRKLEPKPPGAFGAKTVEVVFGG